MSQLTSNERTAPIEDKQLKTDDIFNFISDESEIDKSDKSDKKDKKSASKTEDTPDDKEDIEEDDEDKKEEDKKDDEEEDEDSEEDNELKDLEEELEEPDKAKLEAAVPVPRREILKKYPNLFKDFPHLEKSYYRDREFTKLFPDFEEAEKAVQAVNIISNYEGDIIDEGNLNNVLKLIKDNNPNTFARVVDGYLDHLADVDRSSFDHVVGNVTKHIIAAMFKEGKSSEDETLMEAAVILNKYAFGSNKFNPPTKLAKEEVVDKNKQAVDERSKQLFRQTMDDAVENVNGRVNNLLKINIEGNIDPNDSMPAYVKKNAIRDAVEKTQELLDKDTRFKSFVDRAWEQAAKDNFSRKSIKKIEDLYITKAKSLLAPVVKSARKEALAGIGKKVKSEKDEETGRRPEPERQRSGDNTERRLSSNKSKAKEIPAGMSSFDYLSQD